jgi:hypothetical protein
MTHERTGAGEIDWSKLQHAYGEASDVPALLSGIGSADKQVRKSAWEQLWGNLFHQGTRYSASVAAVPRIGEFISSKRAPERDQAIYYWLHLAVGYPAAWVETGCSAALMQQRCAAWARAAPAAAEHAEWARQCYDAARANVPAVAALVADKVKGVRQVAAFAAPFFLDHKEVWAPALRAQWTHEDDVPQRAVLALSRSYVDPLPSRELEAWLGDENAPLMQLAAAVALARSGETTPTVRTTLQEFWKRKKSVVLPKTFVWNMLEDQARTIYVALDPEALDEAIGQKITAYEFVEWRGGGAEALLELAFGKNVEGKRRDLAASELTPGQKRVLTEIATFDPPWTVSTFAAAALSRTLKAFGLPEGREALRAFLGSS